MTAPRRNNALREQGVGKCGNKINPEHNDPLPKTQAIDPLVGWFNLGRHVKPRRTWKGGAR